MKSKIKKIIKSKEIKILVYFIIIAIILIIINSICSDYFIKMYRYDWKGADTDGDGIVGDVEGYAYLFGVFAKDISGELARGFKVGTILLPLTIKIYAIPLYVVFQLIAIVVKKNKKILSNIALAINLLSSLFALILGLSGSIILIEVVIALDIVGTIVLLIYTNKDKKKIDLYNIDDR